MGEEEIAADEVVIVVFGFSRMKWLSLEKVHKAFWFLSNKEDFKNLFLRLNFENMHGQCRSVRLDSIISNLRLSGLLHVANPRYHDYFITDELEKYARKIIESQPVTHQKLLKKASVAFRQFMRE